ncbi:MAG: hypothetical protein FD123_3165 [Bacteroidetes bacterium]|nr:MAG: hypothetical protein FD123_3165 [Bacteroidota bacterium]
MKTYSRILSVSLLIGLCMFLMACPVSTSYPLGKKDVEKIDKNLLGTWKNDITDSEVIKATVKKADEYTYDIVVDEKGSMFMAENTNFKGWLTKIEDKTFLVLQEVGEDGKTKIIFYVYHVNIEKNKLTTHDITLKVGGTDSVTSIEAYRDEVKASMAKEGFLAGKIVWAKK